MFEPETGELLYGLLTMTGHTIIFYEKVVKVSCSQDQLYLLMFEPETGELLYGLLTVTGYTIIFYEKVVKVRILSYCTVA